MISSPAAGTQPPIGEYALLGDTRTAALVSRRGSVDWLCLPRFDADPVFGRLIDADFGGRFELSVDGDVESRSYRPDSAVLETRWRGAEGTATVTDAMPVNVTGFRPQLALVRRVECTSGEVTLSILFDPRFGAPGRRPVSSRRFDALVCEWGSLALALQCFPGRAPAPGAPDSVRLRHGEAFTCVVSMADRTPALFMSEEQALELIRETDADWRRWTAEVDYAGPFREAVVRSLIVLRQLTYSPSGAPVAAPTMSLPETIGGDLNWDYRYAWPRDAGIGSGAFMAAGRTAEAEAFLRWLQIASRLTLPRMSVLYTLDGTPGHREREIGGVSGYRNSLPVRAANAAAEQHQLDVYGWVVDTGWHLVSQGRRLDRQTWQMLRSLADFVARRWTSPDSGIWEERAEPRHHVASKLMAFVALDRAVRIAKDRREDLSRAAVWTEQREALRSEVQERGWSQKLNSYTAAYGSDDLDAAVLLVGMSEIDDGRPERIRDTIDAVHRHLGAGGVLLYRNLRAGHGQPTEGAFLPCTFWLIDAMARSGRINEAEQMMSAAITLGGELGLLAEEIDPTTREMLGNYPQALSHSTLVAAALSIQAAKASRNRPEPHRKRHARST